MIYTFRPLGIWIEKPTPAWRRRTRWAFRATWQSTLDLLERELSYLKARNIVIQADFTEGDIRLDGMPRANARQPVHPGIRLAFDSKHGPLIYATDSCEFWQHNVRSIALGLEALRAVDRYGITRRAEQYQGWKAIGAGPAAMPARMTVDDAAFFIAHHASTAGESITRADVLEQHRYGKTTAYRVAARKLHPDHGGDGGDFQRLQEAKRILDDDLDHAEAGAP